MAAPYMRYLFNVADRDDLSYSRVEFCGRRPEQRT
jgi:hypothetical protein